MSNRNIRKIIKGGLAMTKEQEKIVIEELEQLIKNSKDLREEEFYTIFTIHEVQNIETVLSMLKEKDAEIEKKDKMIDKMAEYLASIDFDEHCAEIPDICMGCPKEDDLDGYMQCIKYYFERKVEEE